MTPLQIICNQRGWEAATMDDARRWFVGASMADKDLTCNALAKLMDSRRADGTSTLDMLLECRWFFNARLDGTV